jgi:hypothetical protein
MNKVAATLDAPDLAGSPAQTSKTFREPRIDVPSAGMVADGTTLGGTTRTRTAEGAIPRPRIKDKR